MLHIKEIQLDDCERIHGYLIREFGNDYTPGLEPITENYKKGYFKCVFLYDGEEEVGYAIFITPDDSDYAFLDFYGIHPHMRGKQYGSKFLPLFGEYFDGREIILEVDDPAGKPEKKEINERRIRFYERSGYKIVPTKRFNLFGVPMIVMTNSDKEITDVKGLFEGFYFPTIPENLHYNIDIENC